MFDVYADYHVHGRESFDSLDDARESGREFIELWNDRDEKVKTRIEKKGKKYILITYFRNR